MTLKKVAIMASSAGSGKDTVADYIVDLANNDKLFYQKLSLGMGIYDICNGLKPDHIGRMPRNYLQDVGEQMRNIFGENVWIEKTDRVIFHDYSNDAYYDRIPDGYIIPDVRKFLEFSHYVVEKKFLPLYVKVDEDVARERLTARDGSYDQKDLGKDIETQMHFVESLPIQYIGESGLAKVQFDNGGYLNDIYVIDNSEDKRHLEKQVESWWQLVGREY